MKKVLFFVLPANVAQSTQRIFIIRCVQQIAVAHRTLLQPMGCFTKTLRK